MKRPLLILVCFLGFACFGYAQETAPKPDTDSIPALTTGSFGVEIGYGGVMAKSGSDDPYRGNVELGANIHIHTVLSRKDPRWALDYGVVFSGQVLGIGGNQILIDDHNVTTPQTFPYNLDYSRFTFMNLLFPVNIEFGQVATGHYDNGVSHYDYDKGFRGGLGGFFGFKLASTMEYKYDENGKFDEVSHHRSYNTNNFLYGAGVYVEYGQWRLFSRFYFNDMFEHASANGKLFTIGLEWRFFDFD